jgi:xanthine dehydrogenase accessory factor
VIDSVLAEAAALEQRGEAFVLATVVWRRAPSSGRIGSKALVLPDGTTRGWLGGACATPTVRRHAATALADGHARLLLLGVPPEVASAFGDQDVEVVPMACGSEGELAVYLEPVLPVPLVIAVGDSPAVSTLVSLARALGWRAEAVPTGDELAAREIDSGAAIVVATQGHDDEASLQAAVRTPAAYIGLVASRARAELTLGYLRDRGVPDDDLARVQAPAGLDLGSIDHREIAVAVLAELVSRRADGTLRSPSGDRRLGTHHGDDQHGHQHGHQHGDHQHGHEHGEGHGGEPGPGEAIDPICGMTVEIATARWTLDRDGETWYFCNPRCLETFRARSAV